MTDEPTAPAAGRAEDWARLCHLLEEDPQLAPAVLLAVQDPAAYRSERAAVAGPAGLALTDADPWQALLDGLDDAGALAYLEAADSGMELAEALAELPRVASAGVDLREVTDLEGDLTALIGVAEELLRPHGLALVQLEEEPDSCPLVVVPVGHVPAILELAAGLGQAAHSFS